MNREVRCTWLVLVLAVVAGLALTSGQAHSQIEMPAEPARYAAGEIVLAWRPESGAVPVIAPAQGDRPDRTTPAWRQATAVLADLTGLAVLDARPDHAFARLAVPPGRELAEIERLRQLPWVAYAEPNTILRAASDARYPTDPNFGLQWYLRRIAAPGAWAVTQGSTSIVIAVVDSGLDLAHPEFPAWRVLEGWDYVRDDAIPNDESGHGTHVSGILAAATDNSQGISGLAPYVQIRPLKVLNQNGEGYIYDIASALYDAAGRFQPLAKIINLSLGATSDPGASPMTMREAVQYAQAKGALVVAAAGNCAQAVSECGYVTNPAFYPAAYNGVLAVAASDHYDAWAPYSGYKSYIGIAAPGGLQNDAIWSTVPGGYGYAHGTSMAAPLVSAAAALVWTVEPAASAENVANFLKSTADKVGTHPFTGQAIPYVNGRNDYFGYGRLNVMRAVRWAFPPSLQPITEKQTFVLGGPLTRASRPLTIKNPSDQAVTWEATVTGGAEWLRVTPEISSASYTLPGGLTLQAGPTLPEPGRYAGVVRVQPLYPGWLSGFNIAVELHVVEFTTQVFLPLAAHHSAAPSWHDPFAPGSPPPSALAMPSDGLASLALPFPVPFYGGVHTQMQVSENGLVILGPGGAATLPAPASCLPSAAAPNNAVYALALDWQLSLGGGVYAHQPDPNTYVVTWHEVRRAADASPNSFQIAFHRSGAVTAHYQAVDPLLNPFVGAENFDGTYAQQIACNGAGRMVSSGDVIAVETVLPW